MSCKILDKATEHSLRDDLESFIYIVLFCALRWLPITSKTRMRWWLSQFFSHEGSTGKESILTLMEELATVKCKGVLNWLKLATDLHFGVRSPDTAMMREEGEPDMLKLIWEEEIRKELPQDDRRSKPKKLLEVKFRDKRPLHATFAVTTPIHQDNQSSRKSARITGMGQRKSLREE